MRNKLLLVEDDRNIINRLSKFLCDEGFGFSEKDLAHIFERFYKGKNSSGSSVGIGLALARMIVVAQEGTLSATNTINGGAKFEIRFYKGTV